MNNSSKKSSPDGTPSPAHSQSNLITHNISRLVILFFLGSFLGLVLNILQMEYKSNLFPSNLLLFLQSTWYVMPLCGLAAGIFEFYLMI